MLAVEAHGLPPDARIEPAVEDAAAGAQRRLAALGRRPGDAQARLERRQVVDPRLVAVADAGAERQPLPWAEVVLHVGAEARVEEIQARVADAARVQQRRAGLEGLEAAEEVGAQIVVVQIGAIPVGIELDAGPPRVPCRGCSPRRTRRSCSGRARGRLCCAPPLVNASCTMIVGASTAEVLPKSRQVIVMRELMNTRRPIGPASSARNV